MRPCRHKVPQQFADLLTESLPDRDEIRRRIEETVRRLREVLGDDQAGMAEGDEQEATLV